VQQIATADIVVIHPTILIIVFKINYLNTSIKNRDCQSGFRKKKETQLNVVCKKPTLNIKRKLDNKQRNQER
jgi:hypothetical protein